MISPVQAEGIIRRRLSEPRFQHSMGVAQTARRLAETYRIDSSRAYMAGLLHDYAKNLTGAQLLTIGRQAELINHLLEAEAPDLLHASVGAYLLETELGIKDTVLLEAVRVHTLGSSHMSTLDKIIFLADALEPGRESYPALEELRKLVWSDLDAAMLLSLDTTIIYCLQRRRLLHPQTVETRNAFLRQKQG